MDDGLEVLLENMRRHSIDLLHELLEENVDAGFHVSGVAPALEGQQNPLSRPPDQICV